MQQIEGRRRKEVGATHCTETTGAGEQGTALPKKERGGGGEEHYAPPGPATRPPLSSLSAAREPSLLAYPLRRSPSGSYDAVEGGRCTRHACLLPPRALTLASSGRSFARGPATASSRSRSRTAPDRLHRRSTFANGSFFYKRHVLAK